MLPVKEQVFQPSLTCPSRNVTIKESDLTFSLLTFITFRQYMYSSCYFLKNYLTLNQNQKLSEANMPQ